MIEFLVDRIRSNKTSIDDINIKFREDVVSLYFEKYGESLDIS